MPLFQNSVISKYLSNQNKQLITEKWNIYTSHFHNPSIQENIRNSKEEQYQEGFLRDLFVKILGYTLNPDSHFNLTTELKNEKDSKKADGGILANEKVIGVIELKGTNTTDLNKIEVQAFGYKNNQKDCIYVITSNFEKIRFYIDNAIEHIEFNLFQLTEKEFALLYLCLAYENISQNIPKKLKEESVSQEDIITKKLYKDYSLFKRELHQNLVALNPQFEALELFQKSQKLLDRFLFLFFAEDRQLLPPNSVRMILNQWKQLQELDEYKPLYDRFKKYFEYLNTGYKGKQYDVFAYNGGLFKPDEILDNIKIADDLLYKHTFKLSEYDFASEVDVNILGHIFENSLNELDEIKAQLEGAEIDKTKTKRKKDGVFYTPKYITKYIVENTVGKLCIEKKTELNIVEEEYFTDKKRQKKTLEILIQKLQTYREWLLQITIIDPACGSGAFLNEALNYLIEEHKYIDELETKLLGGGFVFPNIENSILENNLFGVDLNEESVEIAKLSLWLRTAQPNRKLNDLNQNIKCGNSLIDDPEIAGNKAFNWQEEFPQVFKEKKAYHLVFTTHNSRISQRMKNYGIKPGKPAELSLPQEIELASIFSKIIKEYDLKILAFNICKDHVHILLVCTKEDLYHQVRLLKSISSKLLNRWMNPMGLDPLPIQEARLREALENANSYFPEEHKNHLWSQKFFSVDTESWKWLQDQESGFPFSTNHFERAIQYIFGNREKHNLEKSTELESIIFGFITTPEEAFREKHNGGFDVVIGNPPYVQIQSMGSISNDLEKRKFQTFEKTGDLYCLFYELGNIILKNNGFLGFITSNKWLRANYGKSLRKYLIKNTQPIKLVDLGSGIFESATVDSNILIFQKTKTENKPFIGLDISKEKVFTDFTIYESKKVEIHPKEEDIWTISNPIENQIKQKIEKLGTPLKDCDVKINRGLTTGFNDAFIIDEVTKNQLIKEDAKSHEVIKPILRGREIFKYYHCCPIKNK